MPIRVLVADDTAHVRSMLVDMLRLDGFEVVGEAADGEEAVELAATTEPDVIVMDFRMPKADGLTATRRIRAQRPHQPIVLYTAYLDPEIEAAAREAGAELCLGKIEGIPQLERELTRIALGLVREA